MARELRHGVRNERASMFRPSFYGAKMFAFAVLAGSTNRESSFMSSGPFDYTRLRFEAHVLLDAINAEARLAVALVDKFLIKVVVGALDFTTSTLTNCRLVG